MKRRTLAIGLLAVVAITGLWVGIDYLVVTDAERIEVFLDSVTGEVTPAKISAALEWVDTGRQPVEVYVMGQTTLYEDQNELETRARDSMRRFMGQDLRILGENIDVEDDRATLNVRVLNDRLGMVSATFDFRKRGEDWLLSKVSVSR